MTLMEGCVACVACDGSGLVLEEPCPLCDGFCVFRDEEKENDVWAQEPAALQMQPPVLQRHNSFHSLKPDFSWEIPAENIRKTKVDKRLKSDAFKLDGLPGNFCLRFWPSCSGQRECSLYLYPSEDNLKLQVHVRLNDTGKMMEGQPVHIDKRGRGWRKFCLAPSGDVSIHVTLLHAGHGKPSASSWRVPGRYQLGKVLGAGAFGCVREAKDNQTQQQVAIKQLMGVFDDFDFCRKVLREVGILSKLKHSHIVQVHDVFVDRHSILPSLYIVMEKCDADLASVCQSSRGVSLPEARRLIYGLIVGCEYLHSLLVYHRDLKPSNCLVYRDGSIKICDFNLARTVDADRADGSTSALPVPKLRRDLTQRVCTTWYRAPEVILQIGYNQAMDVWAAGCILAELFRALNTNGRQPCSVAIFRSDGSWPLSGKQQSGDMLDQILDVLGTPFDDPQFQKLPLFTQENLRRYDERRGQGLRGKVPEEAGLHGLALLEQMLRLWADERISMKDSLQHPFFAQVRRSPDEAIAADCCLQISYDESQLGSLEDARAQMQNEIDNFAAEL